VTVPPDPLVQASRMLADPEALRRHITRALADRPVRTGPLATGLHRAAVLIPLILAETGPALLLTKRSDEVERHKGQISFPGGGVEDGETPLDAALRETYEEIGVRPRDVEVLGRLDEEEVSVSGFAVAPFVGVLPYPNRLRPNAREVRAVLLVPVRVFLDPRNLRTEMWDHRGQARLVYFYAAGRDVIWGATARIIARFLDAVFGVPLRTIDGVTRS
jgi:8-oxo-dGTP pyrophosphatase MutT (NUDIX family)